MSRHYRVIAFSLLCTLVACKPAADTDATAGAPTTSADTPAAATGSALSRVAEDLNPLASPKDTITASMDKFLAVRSYHASMQHAGGPDGAVVRNEVDFVAPDRYRMQMPAPMGTQIIIGDTMYMHVQGRTIKVPMPKGTLSQWHDPAKLAENAADMTVQAQGKDMLDGVSARKYLVHHTRPQPIDVTMWLGPDDLPLQIRVASQVQGKAVESTIRYTRYNDPALSVEPPQ